MAVWPEKRCFTPIQSASNEAGYHPDQAISRLVRYILQQEASHVSARNLNCMALIIGACFAAKKFNLHCEQKFGHTFFTERYFYAILGAVAYCRAVFTFGMPPTPPLPPVLRL